MVSYRQWWIHETHLHLSTPISSYKSLSDNERLMLLNPLLSLTTNNQSPNNDHNCDLYDDQLYGKSSFCNHEDYPLVDDDCSSQSSDDSLNQYYLMHNDTLEDPKHYTNNASHYPMHKTGSKLCCMT